MFSLIRKHKTIVRLVLFGLIIRLILGFFFNATYDFFNILALTKSVADTGSLIDGFFVLKRNSLTVQLYGKIYYQISALWLFILQKIRILDIKYLFDVKPYTDPGSYMNGLFHWGPPLYQLISIKMLQLVYDSILVFFLYKIAKLINANKPHNILWFWAINPFLIIVPYAVFQSDFAMLASFVAGTFFWIKGIEDNSKKKIITLNKVMAFIFLGLGAVIKQVPLLFIPFAVISFSGNLIGFMINSLLAFFSYYLLGQPWAKDTALIKQFFLMSKESMAILDFQLNSTSIFLFLYFSLVLLFIWKKKSIISKPINIIYFVVLLLSVVYITEGSEFLFPQFNIWIMPFLALLGLIQPLYGLMLSVPIIGFFKRIMIGTDLGSLLKPVLGYGMTHILDYKYLIGTIVNPDLVGLLLTTVMVFGYVCLIFFVIFDLFTIKRIGYDLKIDLKRISIIIAVIYSLMLIIDFNIKTQLTILPTPSFQTDNEELILTKKPLKVSVDNKPGKTITGVVVKSKKNQISYADFTVFRLRDENNKIISEQKVNDFVFPDKGDDFNVTLSKPVKNRKFTIEIFKEKGYNQIALYRGRIIDDVIGGSIYDNPGPDEFINFRFKDDAFVMYLRGPYTLGQMFKGIKYHITSKPKFFTAYFSLIFFLIGASVFLNKNKKP